MRSTDRSKVATPANWRPGGTVIVPPPATADAGRRYLEEGFDCVAWYLCRKARLGLQRREDGIEAVRCFVRDSFEFGPVAQGDHDLRVKNFHDRAAFGSADDDVARQ